MNGRPGVGYPADSADRPTVVPVVGIGASAGGLEALQSFFSSVDTPCGRAFVVVQHMDPHRKGLLTELLQRQTDMPVTEVADQTRVQADHVYVIPPGQNLSILHGILLLDDLTGTEDPRHPIDSFFRDLADDQGELSTVVILSGMGTDGTLGLRAIKERGGLVMVQDPDSARFDGMPTSAMESGVIDVVAPASELPGRLAAFVRAAPSNFVPIEGLDDASQRALERITHVLRRQSGNDFSLYKRSTILRRIDRRMGLQGIASIHDYLRLLRESPQEVDLLFRELLIGVTRFFRDPEEWEHLRSVVLPELIAATPVGGTVRAWVPACSTGEEAYSLAVLFGAALQGTKRERDCRIQIFATDLDEHAIRVARAGVYPASIALDVTEDRLQRDFIRDGDRYRVSRHVRERVVFAPQNVIQNPPFAHLNLISCRNLLIYLEPELQQRLFPLFHHCLAPGGFLFLGSAETVSGPPGLFSPLAERTRIFRRGDSARPAGIVFPAVHVGPSAGVTQHTRVEGVMDLETSIETVLLERFTPAVVVVGEGGDILHIHGQTEPYLKPPAGKANLNVYAMAREGLRAELSGALRAARDGPEGKEEITITGIPIQDGAVRRLVDLVVSPFVVPGDSTSRFMVAFSESHAVRTGKEDGAPAADSQSLDADEMAAALQRARAEVQHTREEMQASHEDLLSLNEELQSANEELQSTNEELLASKEEMQALNEELQAVNAELEAKVHEFGQAEDDMRNLLNSTDIATVFLDMELRVRRFTTQATSLIRLIPSDVGRPITDVTSDVEYPGLYADAQRVLDVLSPSEREVTATDGRWFTVRIRPYRTVDNRIDGVVLTFTDVSKLKATEADLRAIQEELKARLGGDGE